jgi:hypothetical protein
MNSGLYGSQETTMPGVYPRQREGCNRFIQALLHGALRITGDTEAPTI